MKKFLWLFLSLLMVAALVLSSCQAATTDEKEGTTVTGKVTEKDAAQVEEEEDKEEIAVEAGKEMMVNVWGEQVEKPQYGGDIKTYLTFEPGYADPYFGWHGNYVTSGVLETLLLGDWTIDPAINDFSNYYIPLTDTKGQLAESWELSTDGTTLIWHIRQGIHWHNKPPMNGREFDAYDVEYHFQRQLGLGYGFTERSPYDSRTANLPIESVEATDKWTVVMKGTGFTPSHIEFMGYVSWHCAPIAPREVIEQYGDMKDWRNMVGTGPWMLDDVVEGSSRTYVKNPDYWCTDERHPGMKIPFADSLKFLIIPDKATRMAAMRTGKIDFWGTNMLEEADAMQASNPELDMFLTWVSTSDHGSMNCTKPPFDDIRVRKAMTMAINLEELVEQYYKGYADATPYGLYFLPVVKGFGYDFEDWPEETREAYIYNPEGAKALLAEAGYPNGFKFTLDITSAYDVDRWQLVKAYWTAIGIDCEFNMLESSAVLTSRAISGAHDMSVIGWRSTIAYPLDRLGCFVTGNVENYGHWSDSEYDDLFAQAMSATDFDTFQTLVKEANMRYVEGYSTLNMPTTQAFNFTQPWIKAREHRTQMGGSNFFACYARYWIDQDLKR